MKEARKKMLERQDTVAMISRFLKLKTYKALMIGIQREMTPFFDFKELGILFFDRERDKFFTLQIEEEHPNGKKPTPEVHAHKKGPKAHYSHVVNTHHIAHKETLKANDTNNFENLCPSLKELIFYPS